jgi:hypothetical protein
VLKLTIRKQTDDLRDRVLNWLEAHVGEEFPSPRDEKFGRATKPFRIMHCEHDRVMIRFAGSKYDALPLYFWMFERTIEYLLENKGKCVCLGAKLQPPYELDSIEGQIWREPYPSGNTSYKAAPHICDILELSGVAEFCYAFNDVANRTVQGMKLF